MDRINGPALGGNAFPKISGKARDFLRQLSNLKTQGNLPAKVSMEGTVKLHGSHADIVFDLDQASEEVIFQSRNRALKPTDSRQGWPKNVASYPDELNELKATILARFEERNQEEIIDRTKSLIVAGEWIGHKVQKDVGVSELSHRFVVLAIKVNCIWQKDTDYADIEAPTASIYNVLRVPQYRVELDTSDLTMSNPALLEMQRFADEAEAECPFAAAFGILKSRGEGIVWKPGTPEGRADAKYWLKTKGEIFGPENRIRAPTAPAEGSNNNNVTVQDLQALATGWVTDRRLEQAQEFLVEMSINQQSAPKAFRKWIIDDVLKEEASEIEELSRTFPSVEKVLRRKLGELAGKAWDERTAGTATIA